MEASGFVFTPEEIEEIAAGEAFDVSSRYRGIPGYDLLDATLNDIFEGGC
jgi:hypothetical protein